MQVTITFSIDNAAFRDGGFDSECLHVLNAAIRLTQRLNPSTPEVLPLFDSNGNRIGTCSLNTDDD